MKTIPQISKYMTCSPHSIGAEQQISVAESLMREHHIRHLPVMTGGELVGILSDRDIKLYRNLLGSNKPNESVGEIVQNHTYTVSPTSKLDEVASDMAEKKIGSAVVMDNGKLVGIFTDTDALRALSEIFTTRLA